MRAEYNLHTDKLRLWPETYLERAEWERLRDLFGSWHRGSKCFAGVWTPAKEDEALKQADEIDFIVDDDAGFHYRLERFSGYEDNASRCSSQARDASDEIAERFAGGQPILVGHHSEGKARRDQQQMHSLMRRSIWERDKADYWAERQKAAERHAAYLERADVIFRRIKKYEANLRKQLSQSGPDAKAMSMQWAGDNFDEEAWERGVEFHRRWIDHYEMVLEYQRELYDRSGGIAAENGKPLEVGGAVQTPFSRRYMPILKVNKGRDGSVSSVSFPDSYDWDGGSIFNRTAQVSKIRHFLTAEEYKDHVDYPFGQTIIERIEEAKKSSSCPAVKDGAARVNYSGLGGGVGDWCQVIRVNQKTITVWKWLHYSKRWGKDKLDKRNVRSKEDTMTPEEWLAFIETEKATGNDLDREMWAKLAEVTK